MWASAESVPGLCTRITELDAIAGVALTPSQARDFFHGGDVLVLVRKLPAHGVPAFPILCTVLPERTSVAKLFSGM
jgi:hypothetical protein